MRAIFFSHFVLYPDYRISFFIPLAFRFADYIYKENSYHIFVNVSESEGIPVSIMEASSFGIPVIATNVGGVGEIVENGYNGLLLNKDFLNRDLSVCLKSIACMVDNDYQTLRKHAREMWEERYNSSVNYSKFVRILNELF